VQIGVVFPQTEIGPDPGAVRAYAQAAQALDFRHLVAFDQVIGTDPSRFHACRGEYPANPLFHDAFVLFGFLAGAAPQLELATGALVLPQRETTLVAAQAAEIDLLTGGRFRLAVDIGWNPVEFEALGIDFRSRGRRFDEQIQQLRRLLQDPPASPLAGGRRRDTDLIPLPPHGRIPLWLSGSGAAALRLAATLADGFFPLRPLEEGWTSTLQRMRRWRSEAGLDPATFGIDAQIDVSRDTPGAWTRAAREWQKLGATHLSLSASGGGLSGPDAHIVRLRATHDALAPLLGRGSAGAH
jgi:probable F420-dependent oxidoreductase